MRIIHRRCAGLDVHKNTISACIRLRIQGQQIETVEQVFGTFTQDLERLRDWLKEHHVKQVAMESTGVYWIPVWNVLEAVRLRFELMLVNPATVRALRGAKTDRIDAARIAEYLQHGLLRASFVPPRPIRQLRDLTRMRVQLQHDRNRVINRTARLLETANVKLGSVASNIVGKSGRAMLDAIAARASRPEQLAELACGSLQEKKAQLALALEGRFHDHFRWLLGGLLAELTRLDEQLLAVQRRLETQMAEHADLIERLCTVPGINRVTAWALISELGVNMEQFADAAHAASWAGLCPGNQESAGKRQSGATRKGNRYLRRILVQSAWAVMRKKDCFLTALFFRLAQRRGRKKAALAVAHRILIFAYHIIQDGTRYREVGGDYFDRRQPERTARRLAERLQRIGYQVVLRPCAVGATPTPPEPIRRAARGRPCLCAERGLACVHGPGRSTAYKSSGVKARPKLPPLPASPCSQCAKWGIACIHARNQKLHAPDSASAPESTT